MLMEAKVGITEFINSKQYSGVIKERYSDFHVHEITKNNEVLYFTSTEIPEVKDVEKSVSGQPEEITEELLQEIISLTKSKDNNNVKIDVTNLDKEKRKNIHSYIKSYASLDSTTVEENGIKFIRVQKKNNETRKRKKKTNEHTHFILYKENIDTMKAISLLAKILRLNASTFLYAGTKDKRGITTQAVTVYNIPPKNLLNACKPYKFMKVGNFQMKNDALKLGQLAGNQFTIAIRKIKGENEEIVSSLESFNSKGFLNYFGMQRFGQRRNSTYMIGKELLHSKWKAVIDAILAPDKSDSNELKKAKDIWFSSNEKDRASKALQALNFKDRHSIEANLIFGLSKRHSNDYLGAINMIPRNTRLMYIHAYQSYIWNKIVSKRIKEYSFTVIIGDLVKNKKGCESEENENILFINENNIQSYNVFDILLPLPGSSILYPQNVIKDWYSELLNEDGLNLQSFSGTIKDIAQKGTYRKIVIKPKNLHWKLCYYNNEKLPLIQSDFDKLNSINIDKNYLESGVHKALIMNFSLPPSSYATMALREIIKDESFVKQKQDVGESVDKELVSESVELEDEELVGKEENKAKRMKIG